MFNVKTFLRQAALALALAGSSLAAFAGPVSFHVQVDTTTLAGNGYLDLGLSGLDSAAPLTVTLSNFTGAFNGIDFFDGVVAFNPDGTFTLANAPTIGAYLAFHAAFGGVLGFDVLFSDDYASATGTDGSTLSVGLFGSDFTPYGAVGGIDGIVTSIALSPGAAIVADTALGLATVAPLAADVPEPSDWVLMATGLALLGLATRRRTTR